MDRCKICQELLVTNTAKYCTAGCRQLDSRLYFTRNTLIISSCALLIYTLLSTSMELIDGISILIILGVTIIVIIPLYQYYQSLTNQVTIKVNHSYLKYSNQTEKENHPVYIYLYINRHTERMVQDEDYSEFM